MVITDKYGPQDVALRQLYDFTNWCHQQQILGFAYFCNSFALRGEIIRAVQVVIEVGAYNTAVRFTPLLAVVWLGAITS